MTRSRLTQLMLGALCVCTPLALVVIGLYVFAFIASVMAYVWR
jgi:hypothetical protein